MHIRLRGEGRTRYSSHVYASNMVFFKHARPLKLVVARDFIKKKAQPRISFEKYQIIQHLFGYILYNY
jgi:hypothetical protein